MGPSLTFLGNEYEAGGKAPRAGAGVVGRGGSDVLAGMLGLVGGVGLF